MISFPGIGTQKVKAIKMIVFFPDRVFRSFNAFRGFDYPQMITWALNKYCLELKGRVTPHLETDCV